MKLETTNRIKTKNRPAMKLPRDALQQCPYCDSLHLRRHGIHLYCRYCEWSRAIGECSAIGS